MTKTDHIVATLVEEDYKLNGISVLGRGSADDYFACAHGVLSFVTGSIAAAGGISQLSPNDEITHAALRAAEHLLAIGMWQKEHE